MQRCYLSLVADGVCAVTVCAIGVVLSVCAIGVVLSVCAIGVVLSVCVP